MIFLALHKVKPGNCSDLDFYNCISYDSNNNSFYISFCSCFFVETLNFSQSRFCALQQGEQIYQNYIKEADFSKYDDFINTTNLENYYNDFVKFQKIDFSRNVFIMCINKKEFDFLNNKLESVNILLETDEHVDLDKFDHIYTNQRNITNFITHNDYSL